MSTAVVAPGIRTKVRTPPNPTIPGPPKSVPAERASFRPRIDRGLVLGIVFAFGATIAGISATAVGLSYFLQPAGALIVLGGTAGVILITTPVPALIDSARRVRELFATRQVNREALVEEIVRYARVARQDGILAIEPLAYTAGNRVLRDAMLLSLDVPDHTELRSLLETEIRLRERQGEMDAKVLEVAGGFAPTIGILGTVVGLIDVLRHFSDVSSVGHGIGTAFVSTIYGLTLANLVLLPVANRIRTRVAETFEVQELILEGVVALAEGSHPVAIRQRLTSFLRVAGGPPSAAMPPQGLKPLARLKLGVRTRLHPRQRRILHES
jgi:chemotaxis protein MotA